MNINTLSQIALEILYIFALASIPIIARHITDYINIKIKMFDGAQNATLQKEVLEIISDTVEFVSQTYVDSLKKSGKFDNKAQAEAFRLALESIEPQLNEKMKKLILDTYGDMAVYLKVQIEKAVRENKK